MSRRLGWAVGVFGLLVGIAAFSCGGEGSSGSGGTGGGSALPAVVACHDLCDYDVQAAGDCSDKAAANCKELCDLFVPSFSADCQVTAEKFFRCRIDNKETASCGGGDIPVSLPVSACNTLSAEYAQCSGQSG